MGVGREPSNSWGPQSNAVLGGIHQVFGGMLRAFGLGNAVLGGVGPLQKPSTGTAYATRSSHSATQDYREQHLLKWYLVEIWYCQWILVLIGME